MHVCAYVGILAAAACVVLAGSALASDDVRVRGTCGKGARSELRVKDDGGAIRIRFEVDARRAGRLWRVAVVHERRVAWRGRRRAGRGGRVRVRRRVPDYAGADQVTVRAWGPRGNTCTATATHVG